MCSLIISTVSDIKPAPLISCKCVCVCVCVNGSWGVFIVLILCRHTLLDVPALHCTNKSRLIGICVCVCVAVGL